MMSCKLIYSVSQKFKETVIEKLNEFKNDNRMDADTKTVINKTLDHVNGIQIADVKPLLTSVPLPSIPSIPSLPAKITAPVIPGIVPPINESDEERQLNQAIEESLKK
jgi:hypothetical protein